MIATNILSAYLAAFAQLESTNGKLSPNVYGITQILVDDLNQHAKYEKWEFEDRLDTVKAKAMATEYLQLHVTKEMTHFGVAILWLKGPKGMLRSWTQEDMDYADQFDDLVKKAMDGK